MTIFEKTGVSNDKNEYTNVGQKVVPRNILNIEKWFDEPEIDQ